MTIVSPTLPSRFFNDVRAVSLGDKASISLKLEELGEIASDISLLAEFVDRYHSFSQNPEAQRLVTNIFRALIRDDQERLDQASTRMTTIDYYIGRISTAATIGGGGALLYGAVASGAAAAPGAILLAIAGIVGTITSIHGRSRLAREGRKIAKRKQSFEDLLAQLENKGR